MRITALILVVFGLHLSARTVSQTVSLSGTNLKLEAVLALVEKQTGFIAIFDEEELKLARPVSLSAYQQPLESFLRELFKDQPLSYTVKKKTIVIFQRGAPASDVRGGKLSDDILIPPFIIKGKVSNVKGDPVSGATVTVKGTGKMALTNAKGEFSISGVDAGAVILITNVGFKPYTLTVKGPGEKIEVVMENDMATLSEVIVNTGIINRNKNSFTGAVTTLTKEDLLRVSNKDVIASLKVLEPALMIFDNLQAGSDPNVLPEMTMRGTSAFPQSGGEQDGFLRGLTNNPNAPLFILDGFEISLAKVVDLDMNRIESITILKDASAKALYGSRAANGVVVIETQKLAGAKMRISYNASLDIEAPDLSSYNLMNSAEKLEAEKVYGLYSEQVTAGGSPNYQTQLTMDQRYNNRLEAVLSGVNTDWLSKPLRNGIGQKHALSIELGEKDLKLIADFSYNKVAGVMKGSSRNVLATSAAMSYRYKKFLFRNILAITGNSSNNSPYGSFGDYTKMNPYWTPYDAFGNLKMNAETGTFPYLGSPVLGTLSAPNPLYNATLNSKLTNNYVDVTDNFYTEYAITTGLKAIVRAGLTSTKTQSDEFYPANHLKFQNYTGADYFRKGSYTRIEADQLNYSTDLNVSYSKVVGDKHSLFFNGGGNMSQRKFEQVTYSAEGFPNERLSNILFASQYAKFNNRPTGAEGTTRDIGVLAVGSYSYDNRFFADASYRTSASSQFGVNNRWGNFWSTGLGWNLHNERIIQSLNIFDRLKLRGSIGSTGSQNFSSYQSIATYKYFLDRIYQGYLGSYLMGLANSDLKWQQKKDHNIGLDISIKRKLTVRMDYYKSITENTLVDYSLPPSTGFASVKENLGRIRNIGLELMVNYTVIQDNRTRTYLNITGSAIHNDNKILSISNALKSYNEAQDKIAADRYNNKPVSKYYDGMSMDAIWAVRSLGIDPANGQEMYLDKNGSKVYTYSAADQVVVGDKMPTLSGTFGVNGEYRGFGLNIFFRYQFGAQLYNQTLVDRVENVDMNFNVDKRVLSSTWKKPGDVKPYKALGVVGVQNADGSYTYGYVRTQTSSRFVQNRNELSMASFNFSYDFYRMKFVKRIGMERLRCAFYTNDVFMLSSIGIERGLNYPFSRKFSFSLQATF